MIRDAATAGLATCRLCEQGFRRENGVHVGSQRLGMIPTTPCERVFAVHGGNATALDVRPYLAYIDGKPLLSRLDVPRRYASAEAAYRAACQFSPRRWHE